MLKRWMVIALSLVMVFSMMPVGAYAETTTFSDMPDDWSTAALQGAVDNGLLNGANGKIMPQENLTRAQMAAVINRAFGAEKVAVLADFDDVVASDWFFLDMAKAVAMGTFQGSGNKLNPDDSITREQAFAVIARALNLGQSTVAPAGFSDLSEISSWAAGEVYSLVNNGYIQGSNGMINPQGYITRAEFAQVMHNIINEYVNEAGEYSLTVEGNLMINTPGVNLSSSIITGDLIIGDGVGEGEVVLDDVNVTGRLLVRGGGTESIIITGDSVIGSITIAKVDGTVRVFAEDGTEIGEVVIDGKDDVILEGTFENITVVADDVAVLAREATINKITVAGAESRIVVEEGSTVETLVLSGVKSRADVSGTVTQVLVEESAEDTVITVDEDGEVAEIIVNSTGTLIKGEGTVESVLANANNVVVETVGTKVEAAVGVEGVMAGGEEVKAGETVTVEEEEAAPSGGGGGGSTGGGPTYTAPILEKAYLNGLEADISGREITVYFSREDDDDKHVVTAEFNKGVKVKSITSEKYPGLDISFIKANITDGIVPDSGYNTPLTFGFEHTITEEHFDVFGDVFKVTVTDGTTDLQFTITVIVIPIIR